MRLYRRKWFVKLCTNDYERYGNYFLEFHNDCDISVNFKIVLLKLMERIVFLLRRNVYANCISINLRLFMHSVEVRQEVSGTIDDPGDNMYLHIRIYVHARLQLLNCDLFCGIFYLCWIYAHFVYRLWSHDFNIKPFTFIRNIIKTNLLYCEYCCIYKRFRAL